MQYAHNITFTLKYPTPSIDGVGLLNIGGFLDD